MTQTTHAHKHCCVKYALQSFFTRTRAVFYLQVARLHNIMKTAFLLLLCLLWSLVAVYSQTVPYVSFMGVNLPNHAYVDITTVEEDIGDPGNTVRCHSDLTSCCSSNEGDHRGSWFFPDGDIILLQFTSSSDDIVMDREPQEVHIRRRNNAMSPSGIYRCDMETIGVNDNDVDTITGETVYVGLYPPNEGNHCIEYGDNLCIYDHYMLLLLNTDWA